MGVQDFEHLHLGYIQRAVLFVLLFLLASDWQHVIPEE